MFLNRRRGAMAALVLLGALVPAAAGAKPARTKVAVLDVRAVGIDAARAAPLSALVASEVARRADLSVVAGGDLRALVGLEQQRASLGCEDAACLAELGGALGVEYLVATEVAMFGGTWLVTLSLVNVPRATPVKRLTRRAATEADVLGAATDGVAQLLAALPKAGTRVEAGDVPSSAGGAKWILPGVGVAAAIAGGVLYGLAWSRNGDRMLQADADGLRTRAGIGLGLFIGGAALTVGTLVLAGE